MKLRLDENLGRQAEELLRWHGHDVQTFAWGSLNVVKTLAGALMQEEIKGKPWTVQRGRVRVYQEPDSD